MKTMKKRSFLIVGLASFSMISLVVAFANTNRVAFKETNAANYSITIDSFDTFELSGDAGTMVDEKNITWEGSGVSASSNQISLADGGYFGISSSSSYGYTGLESVKANFSGGTLSLQKSIDGTNWYVGGNPNQRNCFYLG